MNIIEHTFSLRLWICVYVASGLFSYISCQRVCGVCVLARMMVLVVMMALRPMVVQITIMALLAILGLMAMMDLVARWARSRGWHVD